MSRLIWCPLAILPVLALVGPVPSAAPAGEKPVKAVKEWKGKFLAKEDEPLMKEAPKSGYLTDQKSWGKLWKAWRGKEELPRLDFEKQLVLVGAAECGRNTIGADFKLDDKGDLKGGFMATEIGGPGFVYVIVVVDRSDIKTYNGKAIKKD